MVTRLALEEGAGFEAVDAEATAARAVRLAAGRTPTDLFEGFGGFFVRHAGNPSEAQAPCRSREKEVLGHVYAIPFG